MVSLRGVLQARRRLEDVIEHGHRGDVGPGARADEAQVAARDVAKAQPVRHLMHTCEEMVLGNISYTASQDEVYRMREARSRLDPRWISRIEEWPIRREAVIDDLRLLLVHGSPSDPIAGYVYPDTDLTAFRDLPYDFVLLGHTHRPFIRSIGSVTVVNVGSCGLPRDVGNLACCAVCDTKARTATLLRLEFDTKALLANLGDRVDESVMACLQRRPATPELAPRNDA